MLNNQRALLAMESKWFGGRIDIPPSFEIHPLHPRGLAAPPLSEKQAAVQDTAGLTKRPAARQLSSELERMSGASHVCFSLCSVHVGYDCSQAASYRSWFAIHWQSDTLMLKRARHSYIIVRNDPVMIYLKSFTMRKGCLPWMSVFFFKDLNSLTSRHCICPQQGI